MSFVVNIRLNTAPPQSVEVTSCNTIRNVKDMICRRNAELHPDMIKVIFQGKELPDSVEIQNTDLCEFSVLHAVSRQNSQTSTDQSTNYAHSDCSTPECYAEQGSHTDSGVGNHGSTTDHGASNQGHTMAAVGLNIVPIIDGPSSVSEETAGSMEASASLKPDYNLYYVYCKTACKDVRPGRLRVCCRTCKLGTFKLLREPTCWADVMSRTQASQGECLSEGCPSVLAEFYFKCNGHSSQDTEERAVVLSQISANLRSVCCITCGDVVSPMLTFRCDTTHVMCLGCFRDYCDSRIRDRNFVYSSQHGYTLGCPAGCEDSLIEEAHHFRVLGSQYDRYQRFATEECLLREGGVMCPAPGCGEGLFPGNIRKVHCVRQGCKHVFCRNCHQPYHEDEDCRSANKSIPQQNSQQFGQYLRDEEEEKSMKMISLTTKPCPRCKVPVERNEGCMHMTCTRCGLDWCWLCEISWNRDCQGAHWFN